MAFKAIDWVDNQIILLDQTLLPIEEKYISVATIDSLIDCIKRLVVRGAPALGVVGAYGVVVAMDEAKQKNLSPAELEKLIDSLRDARPTAVNLAWAVEKVRPHVSQGREAVLSAAVEIANADKASSTAMGNHGADWLINKLGNKPLSLLTHCNTGSLATTGTGTALGVIRELHNRGLVKEVYADETRPLLQGSRLTAWELMKYGIPYRIEPDGAAAMEIGRAHV